MKTLTGEIWNTARQRLRLYKPLKKSYLRDAEVCKRRANGMMTVVCMASPRGTDGWKIPLDLWFAADGTRRAA